MPQYNELEQALKVADNPALGSTTERILAAEVRRLQAVNQTINAIWEEVDTYARNHSEIQLGERVSQHALKLMRERDTLKVELAQKLEKAESELEAERKRLDWALNHGCVFRPRSERLFWHFVEKLGHSIERTTDPRATIDELIAGEPK